MKWRPGYDAKEHLEMNMLEEQRRWQESMASKQRLTALICAGIGVAAALAGGIVGTVCGYILAKDG